MVPQHCSARTGVCQAAGEVSARQRNRMNTLAALTGVEVPKAAPATPGEGLGDPVTGMDAAAANVWLAARWREYMANGRQSD